MCISDHEGFIVGKIDENIEFQYNQEKHRKDLISHRNTKEVIILLAGDPDLKEIAKFLINIDFNTHLEKHEIFSHLFKDIDKKNLENLSIIISDDSHITIHGCKEYLRLNINEIDLHCKTTRDFVRSFILKANTKYDFDASLPTLNYKTKIIEAISRINEILFPEIQDEERKEIIDAYIVKRNLSDLGKENQLSIKIKKCSKEFEVIRENLTISEKIYINQRISEYKIHNKMFIQKRDGFFINAKKLISIINNKSEQNKLESSLHELKRSIADLTLMNLAKNIEKKSLYRLKDDTKYRAPDFLFGNHGTSAEWTHIYIRDSDIKSTDHVLEMFTGPGTVANALSLFPVERIYAVDIDPTIDFTSNFQQWVSYLNLFPEIIRPEIYATPVFLLHDFLSDVDSVPDFKIDKIIAEPPFGRYTSEIGFDEIECIKLMLKSIQFALKTLRNENSTMVIRFPKEWMDFINWAKTRYYENDDWDQFTLQKILDKLKEILKISYFDPENKNTLQSIKSLLKNIFDQISIDNFSMDFYYYDDETLYFKNPTVLAKIRKKTNANSCL